MDSVNLNELYMSESMFFHRNVTNLSDAKNFYGNKLQLKLLADNPDYNWCNYELPVPGISLSLSQDPTRANKENSVDGLEISVNDLEAVKAHLDTRDVKTSEIVDLPKILSMFDIRDPDNNLVTFIGAPRK